MSLTSWARPLLLIVVAMLVVGAVAVLACGPAAAPHAAGGGGEVPESVSALATEAPFVLPQSGDGERDDQQEDTGDEPTPTATPYPDDCKRKHNLRTEVWEIVCPPAGSRKIEHNLRRHYNDHMEEKATRQARGESMEVFERHVKIRVKNHDAVDVVVEYLEARTDNRVKGYKRSGGDGLVTAVLSIELLPALAEMEDVLEVNREAMPSPASLMRQSNPVPTMTAVERVRADQWHDAGVTGSGVGVAVIDYDFRDFRSRILPTLSQPVEFFCYDGGGSVVDGRLPLPPATPPAEFSACETAASTPPARPHGTDVVAAAMEVAPDATLYISNAFGVERLEQAVDWLTRGTADNTVSDTDYNKFGNDDFDVKVINHSQTHPWDGSGDGTSPFVTRGERSPINISGDAVSRGAVWVNAAGNQNKSTWFDHNPVFNGGTGRLSYNSFGGGLPDCNSFKVDSSKAYTVQARWSDEVVRADINLDLEVYNLNSRVGISMDPQSGRNGHHPWEVLTLPAGSLTSGQHCVAVTKDPGEDVPGWVQVQIFAGSEDFATPSRDPGYSISNPAESVNGGLLAVGAAKVGPTSSSSLILQDFSARGPLPNTGHPDKPDVVGLNTDLSGTSYSSPRVAGAVALVIQGDGPGGRDPLPAVVAGAMREHAEHPSSSHPDQEWGHGFSMLPSLEAPGVVSVSHDSCNSQGALLVNYSHPAVGTYPMAFQIEAQQVSAQGTGAAAYQQTHIGTIRINPREVYLDTGTDRGSFDVTARACTEAGHCGPESSPPMRFTTTAEVCEPRWFQAVAGDEQVTLWWNPDPDATGYNIELVGGSSDTVTGEEHVIDGLVNGGLYQYRLQVLGPGGPSEWTNPRSVTPRDSTSRPPVPTNLRVVSNISRRYPGLGLRWRSPLGSYLYEVKVKGGGADDWQRLSFQPSGWDSEYSARFFGGHERVGDSFVLVGDAIIAGLIPGTEYHFAVRAARERDTGASERLYRSPWGKPITVKTPGIRPANAPGNATAPALKAPPEDLMAEVDGTTVSLSWTAVTNPNYVRQVVRRRDVSVVPEDWTEITVGLDDTAYSDTGLTSGTTYRYRVRAYKDNGNYGEEKDGFADAVIP